MMLSNNEIDLGIICLQQVQKKEDQSAISDEDISVNEYEAINQSMERCISCEESFLSSSRK